MGKTIIPHGGNDRIFTPDYLVQSIIKHFSPEGSILEPCFGGGAFYNNLPNQKNIGVKLIKV